MRFTQGLGHSQVERLLYSDRKCPSKAQPQPIHIAEATGARQESRKIMYGSRQSRKNTLSQLKAKTDQGERAEKVTRKKETFGNRSHGKA